MRQNFLTFEEYSKLCDANGEKEPKAQADLAGILHALGLALYYGKDPRLQDTRVLNPSWVTGGVYALIRSSIVKTNEGQFALSEIPKILEEAQENKKLATADYPEQTHSFIVQLMNAFQLAYASEEGPSTKYLIPELLPEFEPTLDNDWEHAEIRLRFRYEILPHGLLPRFIVRTHALSDDAPHWRQGVILSHGEARALIRQESCRPDLYVFVRGDKYEVRQVLATIVRREIKSLNKELRLSPVEEIQVTPVEEKQPTAADSRWISLSSLKEFEEPAQQ